MSEEQLRERIAQLEAENLELRERLLRAKNPDPVERPTRKRVQRLCDRAGFFLEPFRRGWLLTFGKKKRWFKRLTHIWMRLTKDDWHLTDFFPEKKIIPPIDRPSSKPKTNGHQPEDSSSPKIGSTRSLPWWTRDTADALNLWEKYNEWHRGERSLAFSPDVQSTLDRLL